MAKIPEAELGKIARNLDSATQEARAIEKITLAKPELSIEEAYRIQEIGIRHRGTRGERLVGMKMGMTSKAKMQQMKIDSPIYGVLTESMQIVDGSTISLKGRIHPRIEPEIAFLIGRDLDGAVSPAQALAACSGVCAALEIIDSRYDGFSFTLADVIADNTSASGFILGSTVRRPDKGDISNLGIVLEVNGKAVQYGSSAAILGNPARSLAELVKLLAQKGQVLKAGSIVLAGGATAAVELKPGDKVRVQVQNLGSACVSVSND